MRSKLRIVFAALLAAAMIACIGAGCGKNENKPQESSAASAASSETSTEKTESSAESSAESKAESSVESKTESSADSSSEVSEASAEQSPDESSEEPSQESQEEPSEESSEEPSAEPEPEVSTIDPSEIVGSWEYKSGDSYMKLEINEDNSVDLSVYEGGEALSGRWEIDADKLIIYVAGGRSDYTLDGGRLVCTDGSGEDFTRAGSSGEQSQEETGFDPVGQWEYNAGSQYMSMVLYQGGSATLMLADGTTVEAQWESTENNRVTVSAGGGSASYIYSDGILTNVDDPGEFFSRVE